MRTFIDLLKDQEEVNISQDHELDYILRKYELPVTSDKRKKLIILIKQAKKDLGKLSNKAITHKELYDYIAKNIDISDL